MLALFAQHLKDISVLKRLLFATAFFPRDLPSFWGVIVEFATAGKVQRNSIDADTAAALVENIHTFDQKAFDTDKVLLQELIAWKPVSAGDLFKQPLGIVLISSKHQCELCGEVLSLRKDRPASIVLYDYESGSVPGTHYHKVCSSKICNLTQYYGYYTTGQASSKVYFNSDWNSLPYFISSSLTAFSLSMLRQVDSEVLLGQLSYKQIADIFNDVHFQGMDGSKYANHIGIYNIIIHFCFSQGFYKTHLID